MPDHSQRHPSPKERATERQREKSEKKAAPKSHRKSWFSLTRGRTPNRDHVDHSKPSSPLPPSAFHPISEDRLRPIDFKPNRISTLYVTPSERNLYLAAMSTLDRPPPPLPLWAEAPPNLPPMPTSIYDRFKASPLEPTASLPDVHPLTTRPMSPKLVKSPEMSLNSAGLMIREEFRRLPPPRSSHHALMTLQLPSGMRFTGFGAAALVAVDSAISDVWKQGVLRRSEGVDDLSKRTGEEMKRVTSWRVVLRGQVWKRKGSEELETIRLLLAMLTALGLHGWTLQCDLQAASSKKDAHNLLFAYSPEHSIAPPAFFAVSMPLPDRVSIISAPAKSTPGLISAVRDAITSFAEQGHLKSGTNDTNGTSGTSATATTERSAAGEKAAAVKWKSGQNGIKLEGWVHDGVYRFWIDGMRRWFGGGMKRAVYEHLSPQLLIAIISALSSLHYSLVGSIPLLPLQKGRDMLIFSSLPGSGVTHRDTYRPNQTQMPPSVPSSTAGTPVLISPRESMPSSPNGGARDNEAAQRNLPWQSLFTSETNDAGETSAPSSPAKRTTQLTPLTPDQAFAEEAARRRNSSSGSTRPLIPEVSTTPRHRRLLLKKGSLRRRAVSEDAATSATQHEAGSGQTNDAPQETRDQVSRQLPVSQRVTAISRGETDESWSLVEPPTRPSPPQARSTASPEMPERPPSAGRMTTESGDSVYMDADPQGYAEPLDSDSHATGQIALGRPTSPHSPHSPSSPSDKEYRATVPVPNSPFGALPLRRPKSPSRARNAMVDVGDGMGVASMAASVGINSTLLSAPLTSHVDHGPGSGQAVTGKAREGDERRRVWDEDESRWVDMPDHVAPLNVRSRARTISGSSTGRPNGVGSSRTRLVIE